MKKKRLREWVRLSQIQLVMEREVYLTLKFTPYTYPKHLSVRMLVPRRSCRVWRRVNDSTGDPTEVFRWVEAHMGFAVAEKHSVRGRALKGTPWPGLCLQQRKTRLMCTAVSYLSFMPGPSGAPVTLQAWPYSAPVPGSGMNSDPADSRVTRLEVVTALHKPPPQLQEA